MVLDGVTDPMNLGAIIRPAACVGAHGVIVPERRDELVADLQKRLGFEIDEVEIGHVDFLRDVAFIKVTYKVPDNRATTIDQLVKPNQFVG